MSFFFTREKAKQARHGAPPKIGSTTSKETLNRLGCKACPLNNANNTTPKMKPVIPAKAQIYLLGDMPTEYDDDKGKPFSGRSGKLLREILGDTNSVACDSVIRDFDAHGKTPAWISMECCRGLVVQSIEDSRPRVVVGLGIQPLQWMLNSSDMVGLRGRVFAVKIGKHPCYFIPTYHPDHVVEKAFNRDEPLRSQFGQCLKFDLKLAVEAAQWEAPVIDTPEAARAGVQAFMGRGPADLANVLKLISEAANSPIKAIDVETSTLRPYATGALLLTIAISFNSTNFAFALDHPKSGFKPAERDKLKKALRALLKSEGRIVAHNTPFEIEWLIASLGREAIFHDAWDCTMMQSHFLDERRGRRGGNDERFQPNPYQSLNFLVKQYFGLSYKTLFKLDRKNMASADLEETLLYNAADTKYTLRLYKFQTSLLKQRGLHDAYLEAAMRQPTVALMQSIGIGIDHVCNADLSKKLGTEIKQIESEISALPEVQKFVAEKGSFNPASQPELVKLLKDYIKVGKALVNASGKESTDKGTLAKITHPIAKLVEHHRNRSKLKSTYVDEFTQGTGKLIWPDTRIHPSFNTTFCETGRTSSDGPNQQNWPQRRDKFVRRQIVAPSGQVLVAFDYGQLEACTAAICTKDKTLVKALWEDYDIHMEWAIKAARRYPEFIGGLENLKDKDVMKAFRSLIKNKLVFPVFFGASNKSVAGYLNAPQEPVDKLMDEFWHTFNGVHNWQKRLMNEYYSSGYVQSPTGRRHHYPLTRNQAVNYPIQSVACDIVCHSMVSLSIIAADTGKWYLHPVMNIHDDLTFCIPNEPSILDDAVETIYRTMLSPPYTFINVPLSVTASIGDNWLDMEEIGKFWSHKDLQ